MGCEISKFGHRCCKFLTSLNPGPCLVTSVARCVGTFTCTFTHTITEGRRSKEYLICLVIPVRFLFALYLVLIYTECWFILSTNTLNLISETTSDRFLPQNYIPTLATSILDTCQRAHSFVSQGQSVSLVAVSALVGKLCLTGRAGMFGDLCHFVASQSPYSIILLPFMLQGSTSTQPSHAIPS